MAAVLTVSVLAEPARANDDDDEWFDVKIMREVLRGIGLRRGDEEGIDYRERSPLVVPPSRDLPPPEADASLERAPNWPVDPDVKRRKEATEKRRTRKNTAQTIEDDSRQLTRSEMDRGRSTRSTAPTGPNRDSNAGPLAPSELGFAGFTWGKVFGGSKQEESATFTNEPPRTSLTQPPVGYQTPAANHPYGIGPRRDQGKAMSHEDRVARETR